VLCKNKSFEKLVHLVGIIIGTVTPVKSIEQSYSETAGSSSATK
jgi:hypothetical protein